MTETPTTKADLLDQLAAVYERRQQLDAERAKVFDQEVQLVAALRPNTPWQEIADRLGRKKQNVIVTYRPRLEETRTVRVRPPKETP
ncbi:hypothetical protein AB0B63_07130 [Micromonospora sp. NPDC049081]|uniref:hypothetical protein n=1 Tax=Micromonospora sp. NPDC049081 TaxID=3155150 RepID=UPI0033FC9BA7